MNTRYARMIVVVFGILFFAQRPLWADSTVNTRRVSGDIDSINVKLGQLRLKNDTSPDTGDITTYRINKNDTRVSDPSDKIFLTIDSLQAGQHVIVDVIDGQEDKVVQKIVADAYTSTDSKEVTKTVVTTTTTTVRE